MRPIKFRAWFPILKKMFQLDGLGLKQDSVWIPGTDGYSSEIKRMDCEVMQFTGLIDKNGKEIYEGDIVLWSDVLREKYVFKWIEDFACFAAVDENREQHYLQRIDEKITEVIGNVWESPELLEGAKRP